MNDNILQLTKLAPSEKSVTVKHTQRGDDGRQVIQDITFNVRQYPFGRWPRVFGHLENILANVTDIAKIIGQNKEDAKAILGNPVVLVSIITNAFATCGEDVIGLLMLATGRDRTFFDGLEDGSDGINLALAVVEVNKSFFFEKIQPMVASWTAGISAVMPESGSPAGQTS